MIRAEAISPKPNGIAARAIAVRDGTENTLPAMIQRAAHQLASAVSAAEVLEARDMASVAYDAAKKAARLAKAKGAHDELIAKAHRAQADALEIEAAAKRRLADEYDGAQERGEVQRHGGQGKRDVPEQNIPTAEDVGLTRKDIHEARQIRDAEEAEPGIVRKTIDQQLEAGEEPTKAAVRKAIAAVKEPKGEDVEVTTIDSASESLYVGTRMFVPEGEIIDDLCRRGLALEANGMTAEKAASEVGLAVRAYSICRQIVMLADNTDLSAQDAYKAKLALKTLVVTMQWGRAWEIVEPLANRIWGDGSRYNLTGIAEKRLNQFELSFGILIQSCMTTDEIDLPYLTADRAKKAVKQIGKARGALERFAQRIKEIHE